jgi:hypothetical protein
MAEITGLDRIKAYMKRKMQDRIPIGIILLLGMRVVVSVKDCWTDRKIG